MHREGRNERNEGRGKKWKGTAERWEEQVEILCLSPLESQEMPDSWVSGFVFSGPLQSSDTKVAASEQTDHHSAV